jgi:glyoxylase-like metal-dependent hydrolase (beta-lactamase superfamily II)
MLNMPIQSYIVKTPTHNILIDSCVGNHKTVDWHPAWHNKKDTRYFDNFKKLGLHPDQIDIVLCTHLHVDHSGWNTQLIDGRWVPTFKNAKYILSQTECKNAERLSVKYGDPTFNENVLPIIEAGQATLVADDYEINDTVRLEPTPGHTPGHCAIYLSNRGHKAIVTGDRIHSPIQCQFPHWNFKFDSDKELAAKTRLDFLEKYSDCDTQVLTCHFPQPSTGHIVTHKDAFQFKYS